MILVTGATGTIGSATVRALRELDAPVRAVSRSPRDWPAGVRGVVADLGDDSVAAAAEGVQAAFLMAGYGGEAALLAGWPGPGRSGWCCCPPARRRPGR